MFATLPIALLMGLYLRYLRPGRVLEMSALGLVLLLVSVWAGGHVAADPALAAAFTFSASQLAWMLIGYGFVASALPVWLLLAPRDYLSTFLKIGTICLLAGAIALTLPDLKLPALTRFIDGSGPVFAGSLFPFLFITIACGSVSGFHSLVSSGTTRQDAGQGDRRPLHRLRRHVDGGLRRHHGPDPPPACWSPAWYFAMNSPAALIGTTTESAAAAISAPSFGGGFTVTPDMLTQSAKDIGEASLLSRAGGAPTLAVGMASILRKLVPGEGMMAFWYHYAILFEALFILTTIDAGTRIGRFMIQDLLGAAWAPLRRTESWGANLAATALCVAGWGYILYQGVVDPFGGINSLWPLFGIANQMLAGLALIFATVTLIKMKRERYAWITGAPMLWLLVCTLDAGVQKVFSADPKIGFLTHARKYGDALAQGQVLAPAKSMDQMQRIVTNDHVNASLALLFMAVVLLIGLLGTRAALRARRSEQPTALEAPYVAASAVQA